MFDYVMTNSVDLLALLFATLGVFSIIAKLTPTEKDNIILDKIVKMVHLLGLTKK